MDEFWGKMLSFWLCIFFYVMLLLLVPGSQKISVYYDDVLRFLNPNWLNGLVLLINLHCCKQLETFSLPYGYFFHVGLLYLECYIMFDCTWYYMGKRLRRDILFRLWTILNLSLMGKRQKCCGDPALWYLVGPVLEDG